MTKKTDYSETLLGVLQTIFKWRMPIIYICAAAGILAIITVLILPVYYKTSTLFLAGSPDRANPETLFPDGGIKSYYYGVTEDIDRLLTIGESNELLGYLVDTFHLYKHYDIDSTNARAPYYLKLKFADLYELEKTKRDALKLSIEDKDPIFAASMANAARKRINKIAQQLIKETQAQEIQTLQSDVNYNSTQIKVLSDSLIKLREKFGIYNISAQTEALTGQIATTQSKKTRTAGRLEKLKSTPRIPRDTIAYLEAAVSGFEKEVQELKSKLDTLNAGIAPVGVVEKQYFEANEAMNKSLVRLKKLQTTYASDIPAVILIEEAQVPVIKSRPRRTILVIGVLAIAFIFSIIGVLLFDTYKDVNWREVFYAKK